ncbi:hypothetical protein [Actinacidiphila oryziradicis]|uniref:VOC family protein n=1 Tax=Actinacidiphila oryziradicis TaxID=2571141 RepID=A0A4U0RXJ1_9ACTN|nr:hypothetical protein [Actinacidiphila oryziradicis]TKA00297.1 hypothetical protein FCI23_43060 [Actinacidiphila oryziradicis]
MIAGVTHVTMEAGLEHGIALGIALGFELDFVDRVRLPAAFEGVEDSDHTLPLALLAGLRGIRLEVVQHRKPSGRRGAYSGIFRCPPPAPAHPVAGRRAIRDVLLRAGALADPTCRAVAGPDGEAWFEPSAAAGGLVGLLCHAEDVRAEAEFWSAFARARWTTVGPDAAWGSLSSPLFPAECRLVIVRGDGARPPHAMNDSGFPSIGLGSTAVDADRARAVAAGATVRSEPIVTDVGGRPLRMALIETPGGAPVELLSVHRSAPR